MPPRPSRGTRGFPAPGEAPDDALTPRGGRVEAAVARQVRAMRRGPADPVRAGIEAIARELGRAMDTAGARRDPYAVAQVAPKLLDVLDRLTPKGEGEGQDLAALMADMKAPE